MSANRCPEVAGLSRNGERERACGRAVRGFPRSSPGWWLLTASMPAQTADRGRGSRVGRSCHTGRLREVSYPLRLARRLLA